MRRPRAPRGFAAPTAYGDLLGRGIDAFNFRMLTVPVVLG
jgi:hypothetical protein